MRPILFQIGPIPIYSYGLMMAIAFLVADFLVSREFKRLRFNINYANEMVVLAVVSGIIGAKILYLLENFSDFIKSPLEMIFSAGGLTWYGGFILAFIVLFVYVIRKKLPVLKVLDAIAPAVALGYGIGRIGCHLSGDGDYGIPTSLPWGTIYANGTLKPTYALREYFERFPELAEKYNYHILSSKIVGEDKFGFITEFDKTIRLHPTPIYEFLIMLLIFILLYFFRNRVKYSGELFGIYLVLSSIERFTIEFLRLNPPLILGLTEAQVISIFLLLVGVFLIKKVRGKKWSF
ncbi:phosphatidylglycerol:prolipoprotein diacylglycerol transferase [Candidatus Thermokryptus mobilis]|uniref:Phosphatidylglycerol--prolipoprotein diacylglyceryl transferase n=1 Tax=Candidatus Thermokryptus mobilis TaxID=1643428 RepID=A0A0S4N2A1_9BACT|nr:prolipoprotein diacylglyceryl transferase [Candidatus Thermokryptus mobilis]CUU05412.1 phosphatidylglycerol:prolipoprotein diacylglycerol transferase [Candidatus Thermokryptus mobilis]